MTGQAAVLCSTEHGVVSVVELEVSDRAVLCGAYDELPDWGYAAVVWSWGLPGTTYRRVDGRWLKEAGLSDES